METWGSGCCRSDVQGSLAKWSERKKWGWGERNGSLSFGGQGSHAPWLIKIINNLRMEGSPLGPQLANYTWISSPAKAPVLVSLLASSSVFRVLQEVAAPPPIGLVSAVVPKGGTISQVQEAGGRREGSWHLGLQGPGAMAGNRVGSLGLGHRRPVRLWWCRPSPRLCLLGLLFRDHALLQSEDLAHGAGGEGEGATSAGRREDQETEVKGGGQRELGGGAYGVRVHVRGWSYRSRFLSVFSSRFMDSEASVTSSSSCCSLRRTD